MTDSGWPAFCARIDADDAAEADADRFIDASRIAPAPWWAPMRAGRPAPRMRLARALVIDAPLELQEWANVLHAPELANVRVLRLERADVDVNVANLIAATGQLRRLTALHLIGNPLGYAGAMALLDADQLPALRALTLRQCQLTDSVVTVLAANVRAKALRHLDLADNGLSDKSAVCVATSRHLRALRHLDLSGNQIAADGARRLAASPNLRALQFFSLDQCPIGRKGNRDLFYSHHLPYEIRARFQKS
ncbi:MAG: hypothetical protein AAFV53_00015 [Myxococcota bacterium]